MSLLRNSSDRIRIGAYVVLTAGVAVVLTFGLLSIYHTAGASNSVARTVTVETGTVAESVSASGNISPAESDSVNFVNGGTLTAVDVAVGDQVKAGQVLGQIDPTSANAQLQSAQDDLQAAEDSLATAEAGGTTSQLDQNQASASSADLQLTSDQQQLSTDQSSLSQAETALSSDEALGCPASTSSASSPSSSGSDDSGSGSTGSGSSGSGGSDSNQLTPDAPSSTTTTVADSKPVVDTTTASQLATTTATLGATVNPGGLSTTYYFEYGTSDAYGKDTAVQTVSGSGAQSVSTVATGLSPDTGYIYRVVARNSLGTVTGFGVSFTSSQTSCVTEQQTVTTDQQTVAHDEGQISSEEESIASSDAGDAPDESTILQDEGQLILDKQNVSSDQKDVAETTLTAPISGTVTAVNDSVGDTVSGGGSSDDASSSDSSGSGDTGSEGTGSTGTGSTGTGSDDTGSSSSSSGFVTIDSLKSLQVVAGFAEADSTSIASGQGATITLAALPDTEVSGTVLSISPTSTVVSDVVTYDVTIGLNNPPATVRDGMTADVSIIVNIARNVLEVPNAAITTVGTTSTVKLVQGTTTTTKEVTIGLVGESETQITSGLTSGQKVQESATSSTGATGTTGTGGLGGGLGGGAGGGGFFGGGGGGLGGG